MTRAAALSLSDVSILQKMARRHTDFVEPLAQTHEGVARLQRVFEDIDAETAKAYLPVLAAIIDSRQPGKIKESLVEIFSSLANTVYDQWSIQQELEIQHATLSEQIKGPQTGDILWSIYRERTLERSPDFHRDPKPQALTR